MLFFKIITLSVLFLCCFSIISIAQNREGSIIITVKDQFDGVVSGAEIKLLKSDEKEKQINTNQQGFAQFNKLTIGEYQLIISASGFKEYKSENITIRASQTKRLDIVLEVAPFESNVEVGDEDTLDPERSGVTTVLNEKDIENLPDDPQELEKALKRIGQSVTGDDLQISVNGVQGGKVPPKQMIQQVRINQNIFSAQYENPYGGGIDIFTRANVKKITGYAGFNFADSRFNAADPYLGRRVPYQSRGYNFNISGPLGKKANFSLGVYRNETDSSAVINAVVLNPNLQPVEFKQTFATPNRSENIYSSINADPTKKHKISFSYSFYNSRGKGQNVGDFSLPSRANNNNWRNHYVQFSDTYLANQNIVNQTRFILLSSESKNFGGGNEVALNVLDSFFGGGSQQDNTNKNFRVEIYNDTTWQMEKYTLGFGWKLRAENVKQVSRSNFGGTYTFSGRTAPVLDADNNPLLDSGGNIVTSQISSLESYRRTLFFQRLGYSNQRIRELGGGANQFTISGGNPEINGTQYDVGFYVQNSYKISETLAASFGLRYENQTNIDSKLNFAPRFGIIWSPKANEKRNPLFSLPRVSIGYGMFYSRFPLFNTLNIRQANDSDRAQFLITETNILDLYPTVPSIELLERFALPRTQRFLDDEFQTPYQSLLNINATKKITKKLSLNFGFSHGETLRQSFTQNINAPLAGTFIPLNPAAAVRPFGNVGNIYETQSVGKSKVSRFSISMNLPNSPKLFGTIRYDFVRSKSNVASGSGSPFDPYDFSQEFAPMVNDGVHGFSGYLNYQLPYNFSIGGTFNISTGRRFNIFTGRDTNGDGYYSERPSFAKDLNKPNLVKTKYGILDPNPSPGDELIPRYLGRGPARYLFDANIGKAFNFGENKAAKKPPTRVLRFSANINNVFNIINRGNPVGNMSSPNFLRTLTGNSSGSLVEISDGLYYGGGSGSIGRSFSFNVGLRF